MTIFSIEFFVTHGEEYYELYKSNDGWNKCPEKDQVNDAHADLVKIEFVATYPA